MTLGEQVQKLQLKADKQQVLINNLKKRLSKEEVQEAVKDTEESFAPTLAD